MSSGAQAGWHAPTINSKRLAHFERKLSSLASCHEYEMDGISGAVGPARPTPQTTLLRAAPIGPRVLAASHNDTRNPSRRRIIKKGQGPPEKGIGWTLQTTPSPNEGRRVAEGRATSGNKLEERRSSTTRANKDPKSEKGDWRSSFCNTSCTNAILAVGHLGGVKATRIEMNGS